jgi:hypothetical protein
MGMKAVLSKKKEENKVEYDELKIDVVWDGEKIKDIGFSSSVISSDERMNLGISKFLSSVEKGLGSILQMLYSYNGGKLISDISSITSIQKTDYSIIIERKSNDPTVKERFYFDHSYKLTRQELYKVTNGESKVGIIFIPKFGKTKETGDKYILAEITTDIKISDALMKVKYKFSLDKQGVFPSKTEYTGIIKKRNFVEVYDIERG